MNTKEILALYDQQERKQSSHPSYRLEATTEIVRQVSYNAKRFSFIIYSHLTADNADPIIQAQLDYFQQIGSYGLEWKVYDHDGPPDLKERLEAHGFEPGEAEGLMVLDITQAPAVFLEPITADIRLVTEPAHIEDVITVQEQVWGGDFSWLRRQLRENMQAEPDYWRIYVAYVDDTPACAAWVSLPKNSQFAGLWGGSTVAEYRQQGLYTAVVAIRLQEAQRRGYRFLTVDASDMSRPILKKHGFQLLTYTYPYTWKNTAFQATSDT